MLFRSKKEKKQKEPDQEKIADFKRQLADAHKSRNREIGDIGAEAEKGMKGKKGVSQFGKDYRQVFDGASHKSAAKATEAALSKYNQQQKEKSAATTKETQTDQLLAHASASKKSVAKIAKATGKSQTEVKGIIKAQKKKTRKKNMKQAQQSTDSATNVRKRIVAGESTTDKGKPMTYANQSGSHSGETAEFDKNREKQAKVNLISAQQQGKKDGIKKAQEDVRRTTNRTNSQQSQKSEMRGDVRQQKAINRAAGNSGEDAGNQVALARAAQGKSVPITKGLSAPAKAAANKVNNVKPTIP